MKEKDTIFLSHSSKDKESLNVLKNLLVEKTSNIYTIFLSSDGQSIPFGTNWVHRIEEGLTNAKVMFIFVTPNSVKSGWIYFEAGFAYSKGIKVVPVGIGVDIGSINPPLNLLQGFNITSEEGLNNIIKTINDEFDAKFQENFSETEFAKFNSYFNIDECLKLKLGMVDSFETEFLSAVIVNKLRYTIDIDKLFNNCKDIFINHYTSYVFDNYCYLSNGIQVQRIVDIIKISIDIENLDMNIQTFKDIITIANLKQHYLYVNIKSEYDIIVNAIKVSSLIMKSEYITFGSGNTHSYKFKDMSFSLFKHVKLSRNILSITIMLDTRVEEVYDLIAELLNIGVIYKKNSNT